MVVLVKQGGNTTQKEDFNSKTTIIVTVSGKNTL